MSKPRPSIEISERIRARREQLGWTRKDLAGAAGVQQDQVYRWESGKANPVGPMREVVCKVLGVRETWLLTGNGPMLVQGVGTGDGTVGDA